MALLVKVLTTLLDPASRMATIADDGMDSSLCLGGVVEVDDIPEGGEIIFEAPVTHSLLPVADVVNNKLH